MYAEQVANGRCQAIWEGGYMSVRALSFWSSRETWNSVYDSAMCV